MTHLLNRVAEWYKAHKAAKQLRAMPDYLLRDIGITREQIDGCVHGELTFREDGVMVRAGLVPRSAAGRAVDGACCTV